MCSGSLAITVMYPFTNTILSSSSYTADSSEHVDNTSRGQVIWLIMVVSDVHSLPDDPLAFLLIRAGTSLSEVYSLCVVGRKEARAALRQLSNPGMNLIFYPVEIIMAILGCGGRPPPSLGPSAGSRLRCVS